MGMSLLTQTISISPDGEGVAAETPKPPLKVYFSTFSQLSVQVLALCLSLKYIVQILNLNHK